MKVHIFLLAFLVGAVTGQTQFCDMCGGTGAPVNSGFVIPFLALGENTNPTCQEIYDFANTAITQNDEICASLIQSQKDFCGCPGAAVVPYNECSLCSGGATPMNINAVTPFEDTCSELDTYLRYLTADQCGTERIADITRTDAFCGCPGAKPDCTMCSDGTNNMANPDRKVPFFEFLGGSFSTTCQELADIYTIYDTEDPNFSTCDFLQILPRWCGCLDEPVNSPVGACSVCSDGSFPAKADFFIEEIDMTCGDLQTYLSFIPADQCSHEWIADFERFGYMCGCATATATCPICADGSVDITNPDGVIPYMVIPNNENPTCRELATLGVVAKPDELILDDCSLFEAQASYCGCPGTTKPVTTCNFCPGGELPPNASLDTPFGDTCGELNEYLSFLTPDHCDTQRVDFIKRQDFLCGCTTATSTCPLCANHGSHDVTFDGRHIPLLSLPLNPNPTCGEMVNFIAANDGDLSEAGCLALQEYQGYCGCPETAPTNQCSFCPNGGSVATPDKVVSDVFTCQDLEDFVSFLSADQCAAGDRDFEQIQGFAFTCGCPNVQPTCTLCFDGQSPPSPSTLIGDSSGRTCAQYSDYVHTLSEMSCTLQKPDIDAFATNCGCGRPVPPPTATPINTSPSSEDDDAFIRPPLTQAELDRRRQMVVITIAVVIPLVLALLVMVYYFMYGRPKPVDDKILTDPNDTPLPVENMVGSISMSDVPIQSPKKASPPAESFAIAEEVESEMDSEDHKIV